MGTVRVIDSPRLIHRDGVVYVEGCDVPVWRLEMARRAGSGPAALIAAFPGLSCSRLELAFDYARRHVALVEKWIERQGGGSAMAGREERTDDATEEGTDDGTAFESDLDALLDKNADVFRRLAQ